VAGSRACIFIELREPGAIHAAPGEAHERSPRRKNGGGGEDEVQNKRPQPHLPRCHADPRISVVSLEAFLLASVTK
jgi:hypothetical protein